MIITELYAVRDDGVSLYRTYSDQGYRIRRETQIYDEAIDPEGLSANRHYRETDQRVAWYVPPVDDETGEDIQLYENMDESDDDDEDVEAADDPS